MTCLILGSTGLLGQAAVAESLKRRIPAIGIARHGADFNIDLCDRAALKKILSEIGPRVVINAAANTQLDLCENSPADAYLINAHAVAAAGEFCRQSNARFVHISTDHYFVEDGRALHDEKAEVYLVNEYARSKYAGECFARLIPRSLVIRTNITGFRKWSQSPTFAEWAFHALEEREPLVLFDDFFTSTVDAKTLAIALFDLLEMNAVGLFNVAASTCASKLEFVNALATESQICLDWAESGSIKTLWPPRADSLGLDVRKAESLLGYPLPDLQNVCRALFSQRRGMT